MNLDQCYFGDNRDVMRDMIAGGGAGKVQTIVTSPPYWGLRDYGVEPSYFPAVEFVPVAGLPPITVPEWTGCLGLEPDPWMFVGHMVEVFRLARDLLASDGTLWMNFGDSYSGTGKSGGGAQGKRWEQCGMDTEGPRGGKWMPPPAGLKPKDLCGIPWRVAFALQADGWYLRQDNIWAKPNPMPESTRDRCTKAHEYMFLLAKSERYYFDQDAILEPCSPNSHARLSQNVAAQIGSARANGGTREDRPMRAVARKVVDQGVGHRMGPPGNPAPTRNPRKLAEAGSGTKNNDSFDAAMAIMPDKRNKRSVWNIATESYSEAHFATFPQALVEPCILAGSRSGDTVLDIFFGSGTTGQVAQRLGRKWIGIELNEKNAPLQRDRTRQMGLELVA